VLVG
jgi:Transposase IS66 family